MADHAAGYTHATATAGYAQRLEGHDAPPWLHPTAEHEWVEGDVQQGDGMRTRRGWQAMMGALAAMLRRLNVVQGADAQMHDGQRWIRPHPRQP
jgi:hypothetical protein